MICFDIDMIKDILIEESRYLIQILKISSISKDFNLFSFRKIYFSEADDLDISKSPEDLQHQAK